LQTDNKQDTTSEVSNPQNQLSTTTLGSGSVYDKQGHIVGDAKIVDVTFQDGNRYSAKVIASDVYLHDYSRVKSLVI